MVKLLLEQKADVNAIGLVSASSENRENNVKLLLEYKANVHAQEDESLVLSSGRGYMNMVQLLLDSGANPNAQNCEALFRASRERGNGTIELLLKRGLNFRECYPEFVRNVIGDGDFHLVPVLINAGAPFTLCRHVANYEDWLIDQFNTGRLRWTDIQVQALVDHQDMYPRLWELWNEYKLTLRTLRKEMVIKGEREKQSSKLPTLGSQPFSHG